MFMVSLQPISAISAYPLQPSQVVSICDLQWLSFYRFHVPGLQLDNEVFQSTDQPHGTVCHQHYGHRTCRRAPSSGHWNAPVLDSPAPLRRFHDSGAGYKYPDLLTYLLITTRYDTICKCLTFDQKVTDSQLRLRHEYYRVDHKKVPNLLP